MGELTVVDGAAWLPQIAQLHREVMGELHELAPGGFGAGLAQPPDPNALTAQFAESAADGAILLAAVRGDAFAGYLQGWVEDHSDDIIAAPYLTIEYLAVAREFRGLGVAHLLLQEAERHALDQGCTTLELTVLANNTGAIAAYERYGFELLERRYAKLLNATVARELGQA